MANCSDGSAGLREVSIHYPSPTLGTPAAAQVAPVILSSMGIGMQGLCCLGAAPQPCWRLEKVCCFFIYIYFCDPWQARPCLAISAVSPNNPQEASTFSPCRAAAAPGTCQGCLSVDVTTILEDVEI